MLTCFPFRPEDKAVLQAAYEKNPQPDKQTLLALTRVVDMSLDRIRVRYANPAPFETGR